MEKNIAFQDLVIWCREFLKGIITQEELAKNLNDLQFKSYLTMEEKIDIVNKIVYDTNFTVYPLPFKIRDLEISKVLQGFLSYFPNIEYTKEDLDLIDNCDIYTYECINQVLNISSPELTKLFEKDYSCLCSLIDTVVSQENIVNIMQIFEGLDTDVLASENKKLRRAFKDITKTPEGQKAIENLVKIAEFNDPTMRKVIESETMKKLKEFK